MTEDSTTAIQSATDTIRLLGSAAGSARLYPPTSELPRQAARRFADAAHNLVTPLHLSVDTHGFRDGDEPIAETVSPVRALAEALHALQVGEIVIAPQVTEAETAAFVSVANAEPSEIRAAGGARKALVAAGCSHIAAIEVSLRAADEEAPLAELDPSSMTLDDIASSLPAAAERWVASAESGAGEDAISASVDRLESAAQGVAGKRLAEAVMRLDEETRIRVLASALRADNTGRRMDGMLSVFAKMKPASLARLLKMTAERSATEPERIASVLELPPETAKMLEILLAPTPRAADDALPTPPPDDLAADVSEPEDTSAIERLKAESTRSASSGRALTTAVAVSRSHANETSVAAIAEALPEAVSSGSFEQVREALRRLDELADEPTLADAVAVARQKLNSPALLREICRAPRSDSDAAIAGEILAGAGAEGAEALLDNYFRVPEQTRALLKPTLRSMSQPIVGIASRRLRSADVDAAVAIVRILPQLGDSRVVTTMLAGLEHLDIKVRRAAITALADTQGKEARDALIRSVAHWDPATQRFAVREIGRVRAVEAIPVLVRTLDDINPFERSHELKKEIIVALGATRSPEALPVLKRVGGRRVAVGHKNKELRLLAQRAAESLERQKARPDEGAKS